MNLCDETCWTSVPCPVCGNSLPPRGRSVPMEMGLPSCCEAHRYDPENGRHLWSADEANDYAQLMGGQP